jgi:type IV pilus assembly protein PilM
VSYLSPHRQPEPLLGLDLQSDAVRLVALGRNRQGHPLLEHCACEPLAPGWLVEGRIEQFEAVTQAVSRLLHRAHVRTRQVAMALPEAAVITKRLTLPRALTAEALDARVRAEAEQCLPFPLQEVYLDYGLPEPGTDAISPSPQSGPLLQDGWDGDRMGVRTNGQMAVLLVAARRERVRDLQALAEAVGLQAVAVDVADFAVRRALRHLLAQRTPAQTDGAVHPRPGAAPTMALFDLRADQIGWSLVRGDEIVHEGVQAWPSVASPSAAPATEGTADASSLASALAEALTRERSGAWINGEHAMALTQTGVAGGPGSMATGTEAGIDLAWLTGQVDRCAGLDGALAQALGCPCRVANPFEGMLRRRPPWRIRRGARAWVEAAPEADTAPAYLRACGLALRRFLP